MPVYHHSRDPWYRTPLGAVPAGTALCLRLRMRGEPPPVPPVLRCWTDHELRLPMRAMGQWDQAYYYEVELEAPLTPTLFWYRFEWADVQGTPHCYGNAADGLGGEGLAENSDCFQITVYDPAFAPPAFLREGLMYQIMVDRFHKADPTGRLCRARSDVQLHADWYETPDLVLTDQGDNLAHDFFGGTLLGIEEKLPYLKSLGVTVLYLNPIFQAASNHKYDVGDYHRIDPMFGDLAAFQSLCRAAGAQGIRILLDGVFSHTGADSRYFNRYGHYPDPGAYQSKNSAFYSWFSFDHWPDRYRSWWGFATLPEVNEEDEGYQAFTLDGRDAVVPYWQRQGAAGWRLDVADELPMDYLRRLRRAAKAQREDAVVLGEVWEDASNKVTYGAQRSYVLGDTLDSVMNYPLRDALIGWARGEWSGAAFVRQVESLQEHYPRPFFYATMNLMGSHDRTRILNVLAGCTGEALPREARAALRLDPEALALAQNRLYLVLRLLLSLPGIPCIYYGDEAGMQGAADPFCRGTYPWGREDQAQLETFRSLLQMRQAQPVLRTGDLTLHAPGPDTLLIRREIRGAKDVFDQPAADGLVLLIAHRGDRPFDLYLPQHLVAGTALRDEGGAIIYAEDGGFRLPLGPGQAQFYTRFASEEET